MHELGMNGGAPPAWACTTASRQAAGGSTAAIDPASGSGAPGDVLAQAGAAIHLAERSPALSADFAPVLDRIRAALASLAGASLSRVEQDALDATCARLDDLPGTAPCEEAPAVPGGGLQAHEDAGGHLIERHVGKSEQWLIDRVNRDNVSAASSFLDLPAAECLVSETIAGHQDRIDVWLGGQGGNRLVIDSRFDARTGISVARGDTEAAEVFSVRLVLERSGQLDVGYRIVTGYPSAP